MVNCQLFEDEYRFTMSIQSVFMTASSSKADTHIIEAARQIRKESRIVFRNFSKYSDGFTYRGFCFLKPSA
ncbi:hypothetical protein IP86_17490 [Rhodopseudomonas sp. AAP120]|nr:hypothetical protein IP86_17490 [Rhodopseudomonas sp. AAP120]